MTARRLVAAIDQGTGSTRCLLFDESGQLVSMAQREHAQYHPQPGWSEHDAAEIWSNVRRVVPEALADAGATPADVVALGIANQRESCLLWDRSTGQPLSPVITWEDTRASVVVDRVLADGHHDAVLAATGIPPSTYFAASRVRWLLDTVPDLEQRCERGEVAFGTMESWLIWNLAGVHVTDVTNASRTNLMNIDALAWDPDMLRVFGIPDKVLPEIRTTAETYGKCQDVLPGVPITAAMGDQQAALFGQTCFEVGESKCTFGTGAFLLVNTGHVPRRSQQAGLLSTVAYVLPGEKPVFALEGSVAVTGSLVQWCRDSLGLVTTAPGIETLARTVDDNGGCYVVPAFSGLYAPHWDPAARGVIVGLTSFVNRGHLARGVLEATAWQTADVVSAIQGALDQPLLSLRADGGMTTNHLLMQTVADVLDLRVERPLYAETVSVGAAYAAGLSVGVWSDLDSLRRLWRRACSWEPQMDSATRERERARWTHAVARAQGWMDSSDTVRA